MDIKFSQYLPQYLEELEVWLSDIHCTLGEVKYGYRQGDKKINKKFINFDGHKIELPDYLQNIMSYRRYKVNGWPVE